MTYLNKIFVNADIEDLQVSTIYNDDEDIYEIEITNPNKFEDLIITIDEIEGLIKALEETRDFITEQL